MLTLKLVHQLSGEALRLLSMKTVLEFIIMYDPNFLKMIFVLISFIGDSCQYWMDLENQKLYSPYYPQNYFSDGIGCEWLITAPEGHIISLEFDYFNVSKNLNLTKTIKM